MEKVDKTVKSTHDESEQMPIVSKLRGRYINTSSQSNNRISKPLKRIKRAVTIDSDAPRYPTLNVTVTSSPKFAKTQTLSTTTPYSSLVSEIESSNVQSAPPGTSSSFTIGKNVEQVTRKLNFCDLTTTIVEEKIECKYKSEKPIKSEILREISISESVKLSQAECELSQQAPTNNKAYSINNTQRALTILEEQADDESPHIEQSSPIEISQKFLDKLYKQTSQDEVSNHSEELFSPISPKFDESANKQVTDNTETTFKLSSSLEELITPYQNYQSKDQDNTETTRHDAEHEEQRNDVTAIVLETLSKAEEYDRINKFPQQAGTSSYHDLSSSKDNTNLAIFTAHLQTSNLSQMDTFSINPNNNQLFVKHISPKFKPPSRALINKTLSSYNIPEHRNQEPFYSDITHVTGAVDVGHNTLRILGKHQYEQFQSSFPTLAQHQKVISNANTQKELKTLKLSYCSNKSCFVQPVKKPPSIKEVKLWLLKQKHKAKLKIQKPDHCTDEYVEGCCKEVQDCDTTQMLGLTSSGTSSEESVFSPTLNKSSWDNSHAISGVSLNNTHGFKMTLENLQEARSLDIYQYITSLVMELHIETRGSLNPDPQIDPIQVLFFALANDIPEVDVHSGNTLCYGLSTTIVPSIDTNEHFLKGFICVSPQYPDNNILSGTGISKTKYTFIVPDELSLYTKFLELFHLWNSDILMGYEIEQASWGYFVDRGYVLGMNIPSLLSRVKDEKKTTFSSEDQQEELHSHLKISGRIVLDLWRILKHEIALQSYTFENLAYHVLHERLSHYTPRELTQWWNNLNPKYRHRTIVYYLHRVEGAFRLIDHYDLIGRTSELARLFGITFYEVLSRGSQFRVESMMLRLAKPYKYIPVSPSVQQRAHMKAPEFLPLILEPESRFYTDPVIVLDFQSLYPSIIIAYNYCFSTCLGRIEHLASDAPFEFGAYELEVSRKLVAKYLATDMLTVSPCGVAFVKKEIRAGIMPRMLREILDTRLMVKKSMKKHKSNKTLQKVLHSRQLGLKLIANVTYGYTAANFSGRMPACEMADSVVSKGRETLQRAIAMVESNSAWAARVVYGDTDSMFVLCAGKTREDAFKIGEEIAEAVTDANPSPVRLKLEKVYQPCILQTKKRYVGYMYESKEQKEPEFEAKGIETVRRDGCPAASKMLEKCLRLLFEKRDVSQVRNYVLKQFHKILTGRVSIQDLTFAKEYRGKEGYRPGACVPALELTRKWLLLDKRKEPRSGERVPYVIVNGPPGLTLIKLVKSPHDLLEDFNLRPNALYYITKAIIPPINRCFKLIGADLFNWFNEMPRKQVKYLHGGSPSKGPKSTISQYFSTAACASCGIQTKDGLCSNCLQKPQSTIAILHKKISIWERNYFNCKKICESCCGRSTDLQCNSLDCPVLYRRKQTTHDFQQTEFVRSLLDNFPEPNKDNMALLF